MTEGARLNVVGLPIGPVHMHR